MHPEPAALAAVPLFASLGEEDLECVAAWMEIRHADPGERLVSEGATGYSFFVLQEGAATVTRDGEELAKLGAGDFFGELALSGDGRRTATVTATSPVTLAAMFGSQFRLLERDFPEIADRIRRAATDRLAS
jgi:cAMP-dependent protein kinase regulator